MNTEYLRHVKEYLFEYLRAYFMRIIKKGGGERPIDR